jgi:acyl transferase domain-containing protein
VTAPDTAIAIVGLACRLPGADTPAALWDHLAAGRECVSFFDAAGARVAAPTIAAEGEVIRAAGLLEGPERFDAELFGLSRLEATMLDPQQRVFLETAYSALDAAGCDPRRYRGAIGVYAGGSETPYLGLLRAHRDQLAGASDWQLRLATGLDFLASRAAYELGLRGPAVTVQTGCSTSLVAIHLAAQALLAGDCDAALAGGATVIVPAQLGTYTEGGILAPDGRCRAFDAGAQGTVGADGVVLVVLKRLADALAERDHVHAVLLGSAINNDSDAKIGFTAPSIDGQVRVIRAAHAAAQVDPATIGFVEAHGTGTALGDPIEVAALTRAFAGAAPQRCLLGSIKSNLGHTDAAAGAAGLLKAVLALERRQIPPTLHFTAANPHLGLERSPFVVNAELRDWPTAGAPRRAAVSSFGIGGTNAHAVLEEAPPPPPPVAAAGPQLLVWSARSAGALAQQSRELAAHLAAAPHAALADVAFTLQCGRQEHVHRRFVVAESAAEAAAALLDPAAAPAALARDGAPRVVFLFPGQGGQRVGTARELYRTQRAFRDALDRCAELAAPALGRDLRAVLYPDADSDLAGSAAADGAAAQVLGDMETAQVAVFAIEVALASLWGAWGVAPTAVLGHSLGAYAAAHVAGALTLEDALALVVARSRVLARTAPGAMLAVALPERELAARLDAQLAIAAVNGVGQCTVSGPLPGIEALRDRLAAEGIEARVLHIPRPAHSPALDPLLPELEARVRAIALRAPEIPWISDLTGTWITAEQATDARYYVQHLRQTVRFSDALATALDGERAVLLEVGPGRALAQLARQHPRAAGHAAISTLPHPADPTSDRATALSALGKLWSAGAAIRWAEVHDGAPRRRVPLPTYAFDRRRYAIARAPDRIGDPGAGAGEPPLAHGTQPLAPVGPARGELAAGAAAVPPAAGTAEQLVAAAFAQVLGLADVGPHDNFFELGGDSLMAAQLAARLCAAFPGAVVRPRSVLRAPTVAALVGVVTAAVAPGPVEPAPAAAPAAGAPRVGEGTP